MTTDHGLYGKYRIINIETGEEVQEAFVLRPDRDPVALAALRRYAWATPNHRLAVDLQQWVQRLEGEVGND